jgi:competence protein ComEA
MGVVGVGVLIYGLWGEMMSEQAQVEIVKGSAQGSELGEQRQVVVDVAGAVEKPGIYKLPSGSRIGDGLVAAGGLSASADREWVAKTLNLAEVVKDGGKVYIPIYKETPSQVEGKGVSLGATSVKININTASEGELDTLPEIGEKRAEAIVVNRPYGSTADLVSKAKIPQSVYDKIKDQISVY